MNPVEQLGKALNAKLKGARRDEAALATFDGNIDAFESANVSKLAIKPPERITENSFFEYIRLLCENDKHEAASKYIVENISALMQLNTNMKEKLNHLLYLPRIIQAGAGTKHGYQKLLRKAAGIDAQLDGITIPKSGAFVDMGCGAHDPLALATYYYLNGYEPCFGIDLLAPRNSHYSALAMFDILSNARAFPRRYCRAETLPSYVQSRINGFNLGAFEAGQFERGFANLGGKVRFEATDIVDSDIKVGSVSLLVSFAVLEHVSDIDGVCKRMFDLLRPGGVVFHFVDLADHRAYRGDRQFGPLSFLADDDAPKNMNRLRAPEITDAHRGAGFEILKDVRGQVEMPDDIRRRLQPRFTRMTIEEASTIKQHLVVRKPG